MGARHPRLPRVASIRGRQGRDDQKTRVMSLRRNPGIASSGSFADALTNMGYLLDFGQQDEALRVSGTMGNDITTMNTALSDAAAFNEQIAQDTSEANDAAATRAWTLAGLHESAARDIRTAGQSQLSAGGT